MSYKIGGTTVLSGTTMSNIAGIDGQAIAGFRHTYDNGPWTTVHSITLTGSVPYLEIPVHQTAIASEGSIFPVMRLRFNRVRSTDTSISTQDLAMRIVTGDASSSTLVTSGYTRYHTGGSYNSSSTGNIFSSSFTSLNLTGSFGQGNLYSLGHAGDFFIMHNPDHASNSLGGDIMVFGQSISPRSSTSFPGQVVNWCHFAGGHIAINGANLYKIRLYPPNNSGDSFSAGSQFSLSYCFDNNRLESEQSGA